MDTPLTNCAAIRQAQSYKLIHCKKVWNLDCVPDIIQRIMLRKIPSDIVGGFSYMPTRLSYSSALTSWHEV